MEDMPDLDGLDGLADQLDFLRAANDFEWGAILYFYFVCSIIFSYQ